MIWKYQIYETLAKYCEAGKNMGAAREYRPKFI